MALLPYSMASRAGKRLISGAKGMAAPGAAVGAAAGGIQGALTNDPNNPDEGRMGRIVSGALGGAAMGAGAGGAFGAGKAHIGNLTRAAKQQGRVQALSGGMAASRAAAAPAAAAAAPAQTPSLLSRIKGKYQNFKQNRATKQQGSAQPISGAAAGGNDFSSQGITFGRGGQWKTSSSSFWSGFVNRSNGAL